MITDTKAGQTNYCPNCEDALFLIYYDDRDMKPEILVGESAARARFEQVSVSWNAHLFGKVASNSNDSQFYNANYAPTSGPNCEDQARRIEELEQRERMLVEYLETIRLASSDYTAGTRSGLEAVHKLATEAVHATPAQTAEHELARHVEWMKKLPVAGRVNFQDMRRNPPLSYCTNSLGNLPMETQLVAIPELKEVKE